MIFECSILLEIVVEYEFIENVLPKIDFVGPAARGLRSTMLFIVCY